VVLHGGSPGGSPRRFARWFSTEVRRVVLHGGSHGGSPRSSHGGSPHAGSPGGSPRSSHGGSPHAGSPGGSPRSSPGGSPRRFARRLPTGARMRLAPTAGATSTSSQKAEIVGSSSLPKLARALYPTDVGTIVGTCVENHRETCVKNPRANLRGEPACEPAWENPRGNLRGEPVVGTCVENPVWEPPLRTLVRTCVENRRGNLRREPS
jgi:hypothetical protein